MLFTTFPSKAPKESLRDNLNNWCKKVGVLWQGQAHGSHICHMRFEKCSGESTHIHTHAYAHACTQTHKLY